MGINYRSLNWCRISSINSVEYGIPQSFSWLHSWRLTWNIIMEVGKMIFLSIGWFIGSMLIFRCYVSFSECQLVPPLPRCLLQSLKLHLSRCQLHPLARWFPPERLETGKFETSRFGWVFVVFRNKKTWRLMMYVAFSHGEWWFWWCFVFFVRCVFSKNHWIPWKLKISKDSLG